MPMFIPLVVAVAFELGTIAIIGGALSAIGGLVGSKELSLVGSLISLGSGLAGAASGAASGAEGAATAAAAEGASEAASVASVAPEAAAAGTDIAGATIQAVNEGGQAAALQPAAGAVESGGGVTGQGLLGGATGGADAGLLPKLFAEPGAATADAASAGVFAKDPAMARLSGGVSGERPGLLQQANTWLKDNKEIANIGGGFIKGAGEAYFKARSNKELVELQRQRNLTAADQQALQRELAARGIANLNYVPPSTGMSLNKDANLYPKGQGPSQHRFQSLLSGA
jgi:hypothetical protein